MSGLLAHSVSVWLGGKLVLDRVDVAVRPGRVVVAIGPNGAGKSTLLGALAGDLRPTSGRVTLDGVDIAAMRPAAIARRRAVLAQATELAFPFTVGETVQLGLPAAASRDEADAIVARCLMDVDMLGARERPVTELSGGERQRVHLARVLVQLAAGEGRAPRYLLLDEPTANLDLEHQLMTLTLARRHAERGGGVVAVLHDINLTAMVADHIIALKGGRTHASGSPAEVLNDKIIGSLFNVSAQVSGVPEGPFLLPQMAKARAGCAPRSSRRDI